MGTLSEACLGFYIVSSASVHAEESITALISLSNNHLSAVSHMVIHKLSYLHELGR